jgi:gamma-glutamylcyclotransferase (GGCT)/AIG2-like uncharacterized protein YtfP
VLVRKQLNICLYFLCRDMRWQQPFQPFYEIYEKGNARTTATSLARQALKYVMQSLTPTRSNTVSEENTSCLFVYGTLKKRFQWNSKYLSSRVGGQFVSDAVTLLPVPLVVGDCGVPYVLGDLMDGKTGKIIQGELWRVTDACLKSLDDYEGISKGYYSRDTIDVIEFHNDQKVNTKAFIYVLNKSTEELRAQPLLEQYSLDMHNNLYHAIQHIQIKQKNYYKVASTWGKTQRPADESAYAQT